MKTIKIIELFNKIANDEEVPKKIKYKNMVYIYSEYNNQYYLEKNTGLTSSLRYILDNFSKLNEEVEIIEEEKKLPEKWNDLSFTTMIKKGDSIDNDINRLKGYIKIIMRTQNEIIDYLESKEEEK